MNNKVNKAQLLVGIVILVISVIGLVIIYSGPASNKIVNARIGVIVPLTGEDANYGMSIKKGVELAKKELKLDNIELVYEDSKCEEETAVNSVKDIISSHDVNAIIGDLCSKATLAEALITNQNDVVLISPASTSSEITNAGDYLFRTIPSDIFKGKFWAENIYYRYGKRNLAIIYSKDSMEFNRILNDSFENLGGKVVASRIFENNTDLKIQLTKIKNNNPDSIYIATNSPDSAVETLKQIKELKLNAAVFGSEKLKDQYVLDNAKNAANGLIVITANSGTSEFTDKYKQEYGEEPGLFASQGYDALYALSIALKQGAQTGEEIKDSLYDVSFEGVSGRIDFDENGDVAGNYEIFRVKNGEFVREN